MTHLLILAGGKGTRMNSPLPKVLTPVNGIPMLSRLITTVSKAVDGLSIVIGHKGKDVIKVIGKEFNYIWQKEQLGTGHAVLSAKDILKKKKIKTLVVLPGDHPLIGEETIGSLLQVHKATRAVVSLATIQVPDFKGECSPFENYGRIIRDSKNKIKKIVEFKDATDAEKKIKELNVSYYAFDPKWLWENIESLTDKNNAHEFYLTDLIALARTQHQLIGSYVIKSYREGMGANTPEHIRVLERIVV